MDPQVQTPERDLAAQFKFSKLLYDRCLEFTAIGEKIKAIRSQLADTRSKATTDDVKTRIDPFNAKLDALVGPEVGRPDSAAKPTIRNAAAKLTTFFSVLQDVDVAPTPSVVAAVTQLQTEAQLLVTQRQALTLLDVPALNQKLRTAGLPMLGLFGVCKRKSYPQISQIIKSYRVGFLNSP